MNDIDKLIDMFHKNKISGKIVYNLDMLENGKLILPVKMDFDNDTLEYDIDDLIISDECIEIVSQDDDFITVRLNYA